VASLGATNMKILINSPKSKGLKLSILTIVGNFFAQGMSAIALIIITRVLGPEKFGIFSVGFSLVLILTKINEVGLNTAILKLANLKTNALKNNEIYSLATKYKIFASIFLIIFGVFFSEPLSSFIRIDEPLIVLASFTIGLATAYYEHLLTILQSLHLFSKAIIINIIQASIKLVLSLVLFFYSQASILLVFSLYIFAPITPVLFSKQLLPKNFSINLKLKKTSLRKKVFQITKHSSIALISAGIIENVDVLFLQGHLSSYETGIYAGAAKIALVFSLIAYSFANVLNPRVALYKSKKHLSSYFGKSVLMIVLSLFSFLIFLLLAKPILLLTIGQEYIAGLPILIILSAASFLTIAAVPFIALFYSFDSNWYFSLSGIVQLVIIIAGNYLFVPLYGLEAAALTRLTARVFLLLFSAGLGMFLYWKNYVKNPAEA
jgi:O-antigen/teichoic acid export membrane protein